MSGSLATIDRNRLTALIDRERAAYRANFPASADAFAAGREASARRGADDLDADVARRLPAVPGQRRRGARLTDIDGHEFIDFCLGDTGAMAGHSPAAVQAAVARRYAELGGATTMLPTQDAAWVAAELTRRFGAGAVELHADRHRRQPLGDPAGPAAHPAAEDRRVQLLLPRQRRRDVHRRHRTDGPRPRPGNVGRAGRSARDDQGGGVQRPRRARTRAVARRRGGRADGACADQHRHRAARARVPGRRPRADPPARHPADQRRDAHVQRRARRLHRAPGAWSRTWSRSASRSPAASRPAPTACPPSWPSGSSPTRPRTSKTPAASAARWPATPCRSPPCGPPSARC